MTESATSPPSLDETLRRRFEAAWREGRPEPIEHFLPPEDHPHYLATLEELVHIELEFAWKARAQAGASAAPPALVEAYLGRFPRLNQPPVVRRLLEQEYRLRARHGARPSADEYRARFPELAAGTETPKWLQDTAHGQRDVAPTVRAGPPGGAEAPEPVAVPGYEILGVLGRGGMGVVYKARQTSLGRVVALKMVLAGAHAGDEELARFRAEAEAVAQLQHPNIVHVYETGTHDGHPYMALEYVDGVSLAQHLDGTPQPARAAAQLVETLARAMHFAHQRGIVHRDLKPANILLQKTEDRSQKTEEERPGGPAAVFCLLSSDFSPKITDFGLAKRLEGAPGRTQTGAILGTPSYMAPEQAAGKTKEVGPQADVYALGAVLYEVLTGRPPFRGETPWDTLAQVLHDEPVPPARLQPKVPHDLDTICMKCLRKDPRRRYGSALDLADDLRRFGQGRPVRARPTPAWERGVKWAKRRPVVALLLAVSGATLVGLALAAALLLAANARERQAKELALTREEEARTQRAEAERQRDQAVKNLQLARQAVQQYCGRVSENRLLNLREMEGLRKELLTAALPFYQEFVRQKSDDPDLRAEQGRAYYDLGQITAACSSPREAIDMYQQGVDILDELARAHPAEASYQKDLALGQHDLAELYRRTGQPDKAEAAVGRALEIYEQLADADPANLVYQTELAASHNKLGLIYHVTSRLGPAETAYRRALDIRGRLAREHPDVVRYNAELADSHQSLGTVYQSTNRLDQAETSYVAARTLWETLLGQLTRDDPKVIHYQSELSGTYLNLGTIYTRTDRPKLGEEVYLKSLAVCERLVREHPSVAAFHQDLATGHMLLGTLYRSTGQPDREEASLKSALEIQERLVREHPVVSDFAVNLGGSYVNMGSFLRRRDRCEAALEWYGRGTGTLKGVLDKEPRQTQARVFLCNAHKGRAMALDQLRRYADALADWDRALALPEGQDVAWIASRRVLTLARLGEHARAAADARALAEQPAVAADTLYRLACAYALSSAAARQDARLAQTDRDAQGERHAGRAVELLRRALAGGYKDVDSLKKDTDLDPLRKRADFQRLLDRPGAKE